MHSEPADDFTATIIVLVLLSQLLDDSLATILVRVSLSELLEDCVVTMFRPFELCLLFNSLQIGSKLAQFISKHSTI